jgi:hypothetical protein
MILREAGGICCRSLLNSEALSESIQSRSSFVRRQLSEPDLGAGADGSAVFACEFMSFTSSPFFRSFPLEEPGGRLPALFHRRADGSQSLDAGRRLGLFELRGQFPIRPFALRLASAEPVPQRLRRDAGEITRGRAIRTELDHGEQFVLNVGSELRRAAVESFVGQVEMSLGWNLRSSACVVRVSGRGVWDGGRGNECDTK